MKKAFKSISVVSIGMLAAMLSLNPAIAQKHAATALTSSIQEDHADAAAKWFEDFTNPMHEANYDSLRQIGYAELRQMDNRPAMKSASSAAWAEVGKSQGGRVSGRPSGIAFDPSGAIYLATTTGGLWKSVNNGVNWVSLSNNWKTLNMGGVAVDPQYPNIVYAGTGITNGGIGGGGDRQGVGVYKSLDGGMNWKLVDSSGNFVTCQVEVNPGNTSIVYRATTGGMRMSSDAGLTWKTVVSISGASSMVIDPNNAGVLYLAGGGEIQKSVDSGKNWNGLSGYPNGPLMTIGMSRVSSDTLYLSTGYSGTLALSIDAGVTWQTMANSDYLGQQSGYANAMAVNPSNPSIVVAGGLDIYTSRNSGATLSQTTYWRHDPSSSDYAHADIHILKYNPYNGMLFALTDGGIFHSENNGEAWSQEMNADLGTLLFVGGDMAVNASSGKPEFFAAGAQDNGLNALTVGQSTNYTSIQNGDGGTMFVSPIDAQTVYGTYVYAVLYRSPDRGNSWPGGGADPNNPQNILGNDILNEGAPFYMEYDVYDQDPNVVAVCGNTNLFLNIDGSIGPSAFPKVTNLGSGTGTTISGGALTVHIAKADDTYMYLGTTSPNSLYYSTDVGQTWTRSKTPSSFSGGPTSITTDPGDPTHVYMTVGGLNSKHFYFSTNNGQTWTAPAKNLPNLNYRRVATDGNGNIFVGHDYGVLRSADSGKTWYPVADGFPMTMVTSLRVRGHYLVAATYGRGMYYVDITQLPTLPTSSSSVAASGATNSGIAISAIYPSIVMASSPRSNIDYTLATGDHATVAVYDVLGREERMLVNEFATKGNHEISADLSGLAPGQYYIVLTAGSVSVTKPVTIE